MMEERRKALRNFLEADPDDSFTRYALALEHISEKNYEEGEKYLRETIRRNSEYVAAYQQLAQLYVRLGRDEEAVDAYRQGIGIANAVKNSHAVSEMTDELNDILEN